MPLLFLSLLPAVASFLLGTSYRAADSGHYLRTLPNYASKVFGIEFSSPPSEILCSTISIDQLKGFERVRKIPLTNDVAPCPAV